jgi:phosphatidylglycerophosphate synthase
VLARDRALIAEMTAAGGEGIDLVTVATGGGEVVWSVGLALIWIAAVLTLITGWDYFRKAAPHLKEYEP